MDFSQGIPFLQSISQPIREALLRVMVLILIVALIWLFRRAATGLIIRPLKKMATRTRNQYDELLIAAIERPLSLVVIAAAISISVIFLDFDPGIRSLASNITRALIIAALAFSLYSIVDMIAFTPISVRRITGIIIEGRLLPFIRTALKVFIVVVAILIILQEFGYNVTALIASFGIVGIGIGLAAQDAAANVFGFTAIVSDNPFNVGDYIQAGDFASGTVEHVGVRSTRIRKLDQSLVSVPNHRLSTTPLINWSRLTKRRLDYMITVSGYTGTDQLRTLLENIRQALKGRDTIESDTVVVHLVTFNGKDVQIRIICYVMRKDWNGYTAEVEVVHLMVIDVMAEMGLLAGVTPSLSGSYAPPPIVPLSDVPAQSNHSASNN